MRGLSEFPRELTPQEAWARLTKFAEECGKRDDIDWQVAGTHQVIAVCDQTYAEMAKPGLPQTISQVVVASSHDALLTLPSGLYRAASTTFRSCQVQDMIDINRLYRDQQAVNAEPWRTEAARRITTDKLDAFRLSIIWAFGRNIFPD